MENGQCKNQTRHDTELTSTFYEHRTGPNSIISSWLNPINVDFWLVSCDDVSLLPTARGGVTFIATRLKSQIAIT